MKLGLLLMCMLLALGTPPVFMVLMDHPDTWLTFLITIISALVVNVCTLILVRGLLKNLFYQYFCFILGIMAIVWLLLYHVLADHTRNPYGGFHLPYDLDPLRNFIVWLMPTLATLILFPILLFFNKHIKISLQYKRVETNGRRKALVWVFFLFNVVYFFSNLNLEIPLVSYLGRVGHASSLLFLFWVAYWNKKLGVLFYLTMGIMIMISVFEGLSGARYAPIITGLLIFLGFFFSSGRRSRLRMAVLGCVLLPFVIIGAGYLEKVRNLIGRGGMDVVSMERVEMFKKAITRLDRVEGVLGKKESAFVSGIARNVNWVDMAVISTTNKKIPYRGDANLTTELNNIFSLAILSKGTTRENLDEARVSRYDLGLGTAPARRYGFTVDKDTSVEWSLLSDSFSRGGYRVYLVYLLLFYFVFAGIEMMIKVVNQNTAEQKFLICVFLDIVIKGTSLPMYESLRGILLDVVFYGAVLFIIRVLSRSSKN